MTKKFHFISGLPRSGSTLTSAILRQNPRFHAHISSPIAGLLETLQAQFSAGSESATLVNPAQREQLLRGLFENYYAGYSSEIIFDTGRSWTAKLHTLMALFPNAKMICLVRDVAWIMDSMERQFRNNPFENSRIFANQAQRATVYSRVEAIANPSGLVGMPWHALREACYSDYADRLMIIDYDLLVARPAAVFKLVYEFIDEPWFDHDFGNVQFDAPEFDAQLGMDGLHRVHPFVAPRPRASVLPPDLFKKYNNMTFWRDLNHSKAYCVVPESPSSQ